MDNMVLDGMARTFLEKRDRSRHGGEGLYGTQELRVPVGRQQLPQAQYTLSQGTACRRCGAGAGHIALPLSPRS